MTFRKRSPLGLLTAVRRASEEDRKIQAWNKAHPIRGLDPEDFRQDDFSGVISLADYGDTQSPFGWQIDHIVPTALGGTDHPSNLRALHYRHNARLGGLLGAALRRRFRRSYFGGA